MAAVAVVGVTLLGVLYMRFSSSNADTRVLYSNLSADDAGEIESRLRARGIRYERKGGSISVPVDKLDEVRLAMASDGLPRGGGVGYEVFDKQGFGTTSFVEKVNYRRALQGELSRTISSISLVAGARVHIAMGQRSLFRDAEKPPSASVALRLLSGRRLSSAQVRGIVFLVASSVQGLEAERVVVVDDRGTVLSAGTASAGSGDDGEFEASLESKVRTLLERVVGGGHVTVAVTAQIDRSQQNRTEETYDKDKSALRSEAISEENAGGKGGTGGVAGARGNLPGAGGAKAAAAGKGIARTNQTRNFEVSRVVTRTVGPKSQVKRLHVAVLVDYAQPTTEGAAPAPYGADVLARIEKIAREAAGIDAKRGDSIEVHNLPFAPVPEIPEADAPAGPKPMWLQPTFIAQSVAALLFFVVFAIWLLRRRSPVQMLSPNMVLPAPVHEVEHMLAVEHQPDDPKALGEGDIYDRVVSATRADTEKAARVLQSWLHEPNPGAGN